MTERIGHSPDQVRESDSTVTLTPADFLRAELLARVLERSGYTTEVPLDAEGVSWRIRTFNQVAVLAAADVDGDLEPDEVDTAMLANATGDPLPLARVVGKLAGWLVADPSRLPQNVTSTQEVDYEALAADARSAVVAKREREALELRLTYRGEPLRMSQERQEQVRGYLRMARADSDEPRRQMTEMFRKYFEIQKDQVERLTPTQVENLIIVALDRFSKTIFGNQRNDDDEFELTAKTVAGKLYRDGNSADVARMMGIRWHHMMVSKRGKKFFEGFLETEKGLSCLAMLEASGITITPETRARLTQDISYSERLYGRYTPSMPLAKISQAYAPAPQAEPQSATVDLSPLDRPFETFVPEPSEPAGTIEPNEDKEPIQEHSEAAIIASRQQSLQHFYELAVSHLGLRIERETSVTELARLLLDKHHDLLERSVAIQEEDARRLRGRLRQAGQSNVEIEMAALTRMRRRLGVAGAEIQRAVEARAETQRQQEELSLARAQLANQVAAVSIPDLMDDADRPGLGEELVAQLLPYLTSFAATDAYRELPDLQRQALVRLIGTGEPGNQSDANAMLDTVQYLAGYAYQSDRIVPVKENLIQQVQVALSALADYVRHLQG